MPLVSELDLYQEALRLRPAGTAAAELGAPVEVSVQGLLPAVDRCARWADGRGGLEVLVAVAGSGLHLPGGAAPLPGSADLLGGLGAAVALLWFGDAGAAGAGYGSLLVRAGWSARTVLAALGAAGHRAVLDTRAGVVRRPEPGAGHLCSVLVAGAAG
ncbi:hypothetical protein ACFW1A_25815 [Kitasatospora sp. NPDC058965]|uniref:hypothetical protein n=1 Tax=Kitasatospora sp. NPDC058965 TaxID=3346682 RepID=UPI0036B21DC5